MRRHLVLISMPLAIATGVWIAAIGGCERGDDTGRSTSGRVLMLGMDGMDPILIQRYMDRGKLPNFQRLAAMGGFKPLATSMPPQSPVAWSNVITGCGPGTHQIYDFIHRDPNPDIPGLAIRPYLSTTLIETPANQRKLSLGNWQIPLSSETVELQRHGPVFWDYLISQGVDTTLYRMPANYPAEEVDGQGHFCCLTGMGTPDLLGSYGEFTLFTPNVITTGRKVSGGRFVHLNTIGHRAEAVLEGPANYLRNPSERGDVPAMDAKFTVVRDPERDLVKLTLNGEQVLLKMGEWSRWIQFDFETGIPGSAVLGALQAPVSLPGMVRFYVKQVHPDLEVFATPINIDPTRPSNPISVPTHFSKDLADATGLYFTAGIPEHTAELQSGGLNEDQWLEKANMILQERIEQYQRALQQFDSGCLFFYFGSPDLISHIFWRDQDPGHPGRDPEQAGRYATVIEDTYVAMDKIVGETLDALRPSDTLIVLSDHGFASFRRGFNLNTWLLENGYIVLRDPKRRKNDELFMNVDWSRTTAYGLGLNGLYINQQGREKKGIVDEDAEKRKILEEIAVGLAKVRDEDGTPVIDTTYIVADDYPGADPNVAPDMLVGYARNYRASWSTLLGGMPEKLIEDNHDRWSGDHCIAAHLVPGILFSNRAITVNDPKLTDLAPTILDLFGLPKPKEMTGRTVLAAETRE